MGTINLYQGLGNEYKTYKANGNLEIVLKDFIPTLDIKRCIILKGGKSLSSDYEIKDNDILFIREKAGAVVCAVIAVVTACVALGAAIYGAVESQKAQEELENAEKEANALSESTKQLPFLKGASNKIALGYNIPFCMGSMYDVPYKLTTGFYSIDGVNGKNQFWNCLFIVGYDNCVVNNISIGSSRIVGYNQYVNVPKIDGTKERVYFMKESNDPYMFQSGSYFDENNKVEVRSEGEMTLAGLDTKITSTSYGDEIPHEADDNTDYLKGLIKQLESNTYRTDICIMFNGLRRYKEGWKSKNVDVSIYWSNNSNSDNSTWTKAGTISTGEINTSSTVRLEYNLIFNAAQCYNKDISIKLVRETPCEKSNSQEDCYLCYINCWQYDISKSTTTNIVPCKPLEMPWRDKTLRIGLRMISNDSTKDNLDEINCMAYGMARVWNGTSWTDEKYPTRNPAAWILEIMTSKIHLHSKYEDSEIDLTSLGALYEYCVAEDYHTDGLITDDISKKDLLNRILTECNATMYLNNDGLWTFAIEQAQTVPIALLNNQSIKNITVSKTFDRKAFAQKVTFPNRTTWAVDTAYFDKTGETSSQVIYDKEKIITETSMNYITEYNHAFKFAHRLMAKQELQPREITVQVGHEGDYYPLYSLILLQLKQLKIGLSNGTIHNISIQNNQITGLETSDLCDFTDITKNYGIIIQSQNSTGKEHLFAKVTGNGKTNKIILETPLNYTVLPEYGNIYSFGYLDDNGEFQRITNKMMIYSSKPNTSGWELTLKDYNSAIFDYGTIPEYKTNLTTKKEIETLIPAVTYGDLQSVVTEASQKIIIGDNTPPSDLSSVTAIANEKGIILSAKVTGDKLNDSIKAILFEISKDNGETWEVVSDSTQSYTYLFNYEKEGYLEASDLINWQFRAKAINIYDIQSLNYKTTNVDTSGYGTWQILPPTVTTRVSGRNITLFFEQPSRADNRILYGIVKYRIQVKRITPTADSSYYKPNPSADYKDDENNYRDVTDTGYVICDSIYQQTMPLSGQNATEPLPIDTAYKFSIVAYNSTSNYTAAAKETDNIIALATSAADIVASAITTNKLADGCVTVDKLHAKCITAEKMASTNLATMNLTLGNLSGNAIVAKDGSNYWTGLDTNTPEVRFGNSKDLEDSNSADAEYFHYLSKAETTGLKRAKGLYVKLQNFLISSIASVISGIFRIKEKGVSDNNSFFTVNPTPNLDSTTGTESKSVKINGKLTLGSTSSVSMGIDRNDIQVRNGQIATDLYLNNLGGKVHIGRDGLVPTYSVTGSLTPVSTVTRKWLKIGDVAWNETPVISVTINGNGFADQLIIKVNGGQGTLAQVCGIASQNSNLTKAVYINPSTTWNGKFSIGIIVDQLTTIGSIKIAKISGNITLNTDPHFNETTAIPSGIETYKIGRGLFGNLNSNTINTGSLICTTRLKIPRGAPPKPTNGDIWIS